MRIKTMSYGYNDDDYNDDDIDDYGDHNNNDDVKVIHRKESFSKSLCCIWYQTNSTKYKFNTVYEATKAYIRDRQEVSCITGFIGTRS